MLPLNENKPAISSLGARGEFEEIIASEEPSVIVIAVVTAKNGIMFTFFLSRRQSFIFSKISASHNLMKYQRNAKKRRKVKESVLCSRSTCQNTTQREPQCGVCAVIIPRWHREL